MNQFGKTALHVCVEMNLQDQVLYLLFKGANQHMLDLEEKDCCDKAKENGLAKLIPEFNDCNIKKKIVPILFNGREPTHY